MAGTALFRPATVADGEFPAGRSVVRLPPGSGGSGGSGAAAPGHANVVRRVRHLARRAALSPQQGRTVAAPQPVGFQARRFARGAPAFDSLQPSTALAGDQYRT